MKYQNVKYGDPKPNPEKLIYVDPRDVNYLLIPKLIPCSSGTWIYSGDWDQKLCPYDYVSMYDDWDSWSSLVDAQRVKGPCLIKINSLSHYSGFKSTFSEDGVDRNSDFYENLSRNYKINDTKYNSPKKIKNRLDYDMELYNKLKDNGYDISEVSKGEHIDIAIGRRGELLKLPTGGEHRFIFSKILGLNQIPVKVRLRHSKWQKVRNNKYNNGLDKLEINMYSDHPDLDNL